MKIDFGDIAHFLPADTLLMLANVSEDIAAWCLEHAGSAQEVAGWVWYETGPTAHEMSLHRLTSDTLPVHALAGRAVTGRTNNAMQPDGCAASKEALEWGAALRGNRVPRSGAASVPGHVFDASVSEAMEHNAPLRNSLSATGNAARAAVFHCALRQARAAVTEGGHDLHPATRARLEDDIRDMHAALAEAGAWALNEIDNALFTYLSPPDLVTHSDAFYLLSDRVSDFVAELVGQALRKAR